MALGLGEMKLESFLNEPLKASVDLLNLGALHEDEVKIRLATSEDFDKLGLERAYFLTNISFEVVADDRGGARIIISSEEPVLEPYLDFIVEARWPSGRLLREYTVLIDPPVFSPATPVVSASERVEEVERIAAPAKKNEQTTTSGTQVDVRDSDLAPGAMPHRGYNASTANTPTPGSQYMISRDQTLWEIASQAKPDGASVHQTMLDIQRLNPDAFINGNINRIKAGYIIYLPSADDISSADLSSALSEVRQQNEAWREGRDRELYANSGPSLRISAEPEDATVETSTGTPGSGAATAATVDQESAPGGSSVAAGGEMPAPASADGAERMAALQEQLETLQRIVSLKDDQIAALQNALADAGGTDTSAVEPALEEGAPALLEGVEVTEVEDVVTEPATEEQAVSQTVAGEETEAAAPPPSESPKPTPAATKPAAEREAPASGESWTSYLLYIVGAAILAVLGFMFARRRGADDEDSAATLRADAENDAFSDVRLQDHNLEIESETDDEEPGEPQPAPVSRNNRGYGEHKHDEYASDIDAADALAEADIYIAYGRHPQAIDLLNNALAGEPGNPVYRLKLLEIYVELNNRVAATAQLKKIQSLGDPDSTARAESLMDGLGGEEEPQPQKSSVQTPVKGGSGLSPNPLAMMTDSTDSLEADFSGLEIEEQEAAAEDDDLDLSGDFTTGGSADNFDDEELVIAADSNGMSTKLDLARAYLDMGDDDGARQILDEVVAEGTDELKAEARALLDRIGG
jgi:pilus assembly protein FimV